MVSITKLPILCVALIAGLGVAVGSARASENKALEKEVLTAFVKGQDHIDKLKGMKDISPNYPALVAALTDYDLWDHGMLVEMVIDEGGQALVPALEMKLTTTVNCLPQFAVACQPTLADRNSDILRALWYFEHPP